MMEHKNIPKIAIVVARQIIQQGKFYWDKIKRIAPSLNIQLGEPKWFEVPDSRVTSYTSVIEKSVARLTPDITVVMIPKVDGEMYSTLKKLMTCRYIQRFHVKILCGSAFSFQVRHVISSHHGSENLEQGQASRVYSHENPNSNGHKIGSSALAFENSAKGRYGSRVRRSKEQRPRRQKFRSLCGING